MMEWSLELEPKPSAPRQAREAVAERVYDFPQVLLNDLKLLVSEVVTNAVRHAGVAPSDTIGVHLTRDDDGVRVEVCDPARTDGAPTVRPASDQRAGGYGLRMVESIAAEWGVRRNARTCVWFLVPNP